MRMTLLCAVLLSVPLAAQDVDLQSAVNTIDVPPFIDHVTTDLQPSVPNGEDSGRSRIGFDWPAFSIYLGGLTADGLTTARATRNGSGCVEGNRALRAQPTTGELARYIAPQIAVGALIGWMAQKTQNRSDSTPGQRLFVKWFARGFFWGRGAMGVEAAVHNVRLCGW